MSGYPTRISRNALGPKPANRYQVTDPAKAFSAELGDLLFWQTAGMNIVSDRAFAICDGATATVLASGAAWDPNGALPPPTIVRSSAGIYVVTWPATVPDKDAQLVAPSLLAAKAHPQSASPVLIGGAKVRVDARTVDVSIVTLGNVATDAAFLLEVK